MEKTGGRLWVIDFRSKVFTRNIDSFFFFNDTNIKISVWNFTTLFWLIRNEVKCVWFLQPWDRTRRTFDTCGAEGGRNFPSKLHTYYKKLIILHIVIISFVFFVKCKRWICWHNLTGTPKKKFHVRLLMVAKKNYNDKSDPMVFVVQTIKCNMHNVHWVLYLLISGIF